MAITDRTARVKGSTPTIAVAEVIIDAAFGSRVTRVTNGASLTDLGTTNRSFRSPGSGYQQAWNADGTKFYVLHGDGTASLWSFNRSTMVTARVGTLLPLLGALTWDPTNANLVYGTKAAANNHTLGVVDVSSLPLTATVLLDLDTVTANLNVPDVTYVGALTVGAGNLLVSYGGVGQEYMRYHLWYPLSNPSAKKVLDTKTQTGMDAFNSLFTSHGAQIDKSGRYPSIVPTEQVAPVAPYKTYIWDTTLDTVTPITTHSGGHEVLGYSARLNSDTLTAFDAVQYILIPSLLTPMSGRVELVSPLGSPQQIFEADHTTWNNASATEMKPVISGVYRYLDGPNNEAPNKNEVAWRAWDDEIISCATDGTGTVTRYCHHRSLVWPLVGVGTFEFWATPRPNVDLQGKFAIFTSNWDHTLGDDSVEANMKRQDVFVVELISDPVQDLRVVSPRRDGAFFIR